MLVWSIKTSMHSLKKTIKNVIRDMILMFISMAVIFSLMYVLYIKLQFDTYHGALLSYFVTTILYDNSIHLLGL